MTASGQAHRIAAGGPVEGLSRGGPPVDGHRLLVVVPHRHPAHIEPVAAPLFSPVKAAEHQRGVTDVESAEASANRIPDDLALIAGLMGAARSHLHHVLQRQRPLPGCFQGLVGPIDVSLLRDVVGVNRDAPQTEFKISEHSSLVRR